MASLGGLTKTVVAFLLLVLVVTAALPKAAATWDTSHVVSLNQYKSSSGPAVLWNPVLKKLFIAYATQYLSQIHVLSTSQDPYIGSAYSDLDLQRPAYGGGEPGAVSLAYDQKDGNMYLAYANLNSPCVIVSNGVCWDVGVVKSRDGASWTYASLVANFTPPTPLAMEGPSITYNSDNGSLVMAFIPPDDSHRIFIYRSYDGNNWSMVNAFSTFPGVINCCGSTNTYWQPGNPYIANAVSIRFFSHQFYLSFDAPDNSIYVLNSRDLLNWIEPSPLPEKSSVQAPITIDPIAGSFHLDWAGTDPQHTLNDIQSVDGTYWQSKQTLGGLTAKFGVSTDFINCVLVNSVCHYYIAMAWTGNDQGLYLVLWTPPPGSGGGGGGCGGTPGHPYLC
jgi:hypothetical protein